MAVKIQKNASNKKIIIIRCKTVLHGSQLVHDGSRWWFHDASRWFSMVFDKSKPKKKESVEKEKNSEAFTMDKITTGKGQ